MTFSRASIAMSAAEHLSQPWSPSRLSRRPTCRGRQCKVPFGSSGRCWTTPRRTACRRRAGRADGGDGSQRVESVRYVAWSTAQRPWPHNLAGYDRVGWSPPYVIASGSCRSWWDAALGVQQALSSRFDPYAPRSSGTYAASCGRRPPRRAARLVLAHVGHTQGRDQEAGSSGTSPPRTSSGRPVPGRGPTRASSSRPTVPSSVPTGARRSCSPASPV